MKAIKRIILLGGAIGLLGASVAFSPKPIGALAEGEETSQTEAETEALEDKDGNGIPDSVEKFYDENIRDRMVFGISLGTIIGLAGSVLSAIVILVRVGLALKSIKGENKKTNDVSEATAEDLGKLVKAMAEYVDSLNRRIEQCERKADENMQRFEAAADELSQHIKYENLSYAVLSVLEELARNPETASKGSYDRIKKIVEEAKKDVQAEE